MIDFVATDAEKNIFYKCQLYKGENFEKVKKLVSIFSGVASRR